MVERRLLDPKGRQSQFAPLIYRPMLSSAIDLRAEGHRRQSSSFKRLEERKKRLTGQWIILDIEIGRLAVNEEKIRGLIGDQHSIL